MHAQTGAAASRRREIGLQNIADSLDERGAGKSRGRCRQFSLILRPFQIESEIVIFW